MTTCDFVPDECASLAIQACILAKKCKIAEFQFDGLKVSIGGTEQLVADIRAELDVQATCLLEAMQALYTAAGCPFPAVPPIPSAPDLSECNNAVDQLQGQVDDVLGFLSGLMTITLDANDKPIRITVP